MYACIVKIKIKEELSDGHRLTQIRETPVPVSLKIESDNTDEELAGNVNRMRIQN